MALTLNVWTATNKKTVEIDPGGTVEKYILFYDSEMRKAAEKAGDLITDEMFCGVATDIYINDMQEPIGVDGMHRVLNDGDILHISHRPQAGLTLFAKVIIAVIVAIAIVALVPRPSIPKINGLNSGGSADSPNNRLSGQTNIARPYQAIPEIFGKIISYPDLIQPSIFEYVDNIKLVREVFCVGVGAYTFGSIRDGQTPISSIPGSSAQIFGPGTSPSDLQISRESNDVNGQELQAANDATREYSGRVIFINRNNSELAQDVVFDSAGFFTSTTLTLAWLLDLKPNDAITVSGTVSNNGSFTVSSVTLDQSGGIDKIRVTVSQTVTSETLSSATVTQSVTPISGIYAFSGNIVDNLQLDESNSFQVSETSSNNGVFSFTANTTRNVQTIITGAVIEATEFVVTELFTNEDDSEAVVRRTGTPAVPWVGWFQLSGEMDQIWTHYQAPQGLQDSQGSTINVQIQIQTQETSQDGTPTGTIVTQNITLRGGSIDPLFRTLKIIVPSKGFYRIRSRRVTDRFSGNAVDLIKWEDAFSVENYISTFGDVTLSMFEPGRQTLR